MSNKVAQTSLICPECGNIFKIWRLKCHQRNLYHKKNLFCVKCNKETNHIELKDIDLYLSSLEFKNEEDFTEEEKEVWQLIKKRGE